MKPNKIRAWLAANRCFYLFVALVVLLVLLPLFDGSEGGKLAFSGASLAVLISALVPLARSRRELGAALVFAVPAIATLVAAHALASEAWLVASWAFSAGVLVVTIVQLFLYVLRPAHDSEIPVDRVFGGISAYLVIGFLWAYLAALLERAAPGAFAGIDASRPPHVADFVIFSFDSITTIGGGGVSAQSRGARTLFMLETLLGTLYLAGFVARIVSIYAGRKG
jgi:hypothetical protein